MRTALVLLLAPLAIFAACGDDDTTPAPVTGGGVDAGSSSSGSSSSSSGNSSSSSGNSSSSSGDPGPCDEAHYVNGVTPSPSAGKLSFHSENNIDGNIPVATGTPDGCTAKFDPAAGVMVGSSMSGALDIQCSGTDEHLYYGYHLHTLGKPTLGAQYKIGKAGLDGAALNNQFDFTVEGGSRCGDKAATLREWAGEASAALGHGMMYIDGLTGDQLQVHTSLTEMKVSPNNVAGKGTFSAQVTNGTVTVTGL